MKSNGNEANGGSLSKDWYQVSGIGEGGVRG